MIRKAVLYIVRKNFEDIELLVFDHPVTSLTQVIRGGVDDKELPEQTIYREALEEAGIQLSRVHFLGSKILDVPGRRDRSGAMEKQEHFAFAGFVESGLPEKWTFNASGNGIDYGDKYSFYWIKLTPDAHTLLKSEAQCFLVELNNFLASNDSFFKSL